MELMTAKEGQVLLRISASTWARMRRAGTLPEPVRLGSGGVLRWRKADLVALISGVAA